MATIKQGQWEATFKKPVAAFDKAVKSGPKGDKAVDTISKALSKLNSDGMKRLKVCDQTFGVYVKSDAEQDDQPDLFRKFYKAADDFNDTFKAIKACVEKNAGKKAIKDEPAAHGAARELLTMADEIAKQHIELKFAIEAEIKAGMRRAKKAATAVDDLHKSTDKALKELKKLERDDPFEDARDNRARAKAADKFVEELSKIAESVMDECDAIESYRKKGFAFAITDRETGSFEKLLRPYLKQKIKAPESMEHVEEQLEDFKKVLEAVQKTAKKRAAETKKMKTA